MTITSDPRLPWRMRIYSTDTEEYNQIRDKGSGRSARTSVAGAGSLARRAAFLAQRVFTSDLIYVEPVFLGFNLITGASKGKRTERANVIRRQGTEGQMSATQSTRRPNLRGEKHAPKRDIKGREP